MELAMKDKVAIVTGGSSGIGQATALEFATQGAQVVVAARREAQGVETVEQIETLGGQGTFVKTDVTQALEIERLVQQTLETYGRLDYACNNAGFGKTVPLLERTESEWDSEIDVNLKAVWLCMKYQIPAMQQTGGGSILNMASMGGGVIGVPELSSYNAAKSGVVGLTRSAALEFAQKNIRINCISPGLIATDILSNVSPETVNAMVASIPMQRAGEATEIAKAVVWLCSENASYVTGQNLVIDGGFTVQ
ncbi:glucose 1-dehydrogenase [Acaryochloris marina NIES-2412]|uniref:glucose 1-dehydrogenase n=1 Tax=Acaryochloris marina TaxID=155978 RepID=UPI004058F705